MSRIAVHGPLIRPLLSEEGELFGRIRHNTARATNCRRHARRDLWSNVSLHCCERHTLARRGDRTWAADRARVSHRLSITAQGFLSLRRHIVAWSRLRHPNVMPLRGVAVDVRVGIFHSDTFTHVTLLRDTGAGDRRSLHLDRDGRCVQP